MHTDGSMLNAVTDLCNRKRRGVGSKNTLRLHNLVQLCKCGLLYLHILECSLNDQIAVCTEIFLQARSNACKNSVNLLLCHFTFLNKSCITLCNLVLTAFSPLLLDIAECNLIAVNLGKCLCNALAHCSCANNANLHDLCTS